jgi:hypothetical protein
MDGGFQPLARRDGTRGAEENKSSHPHDENHYSNQTGHAAHWPARIN